MKIELEESIIIIMAIFAILVFTSIYVNNSIMIYVWILFFAISALIILAMSIKRSKTQKNRHIDRIPNIVYILDILVIILVILGVITGINILATIAVILLIVILIIQLYGWLNSN